MNESVKHVNLSKLLNKHKGVGCSVQNGPRLAEIRKSIGLKIPIWTRVGPEPFKGAFCSTLGQLQPEQKKIDSYGY